MIRRAALCLSLSLLAAGCSSRPDITAKESAHAAQAAYPKLAPIDALLADSRAPNRAAAAETELGARASGLRSRAAALRQRG